MTAHVPTPESRADAFTVFYRTHVVAVRAQVRVWVSAADVDEIVSATFMTAWTRFDDVPAEAPKAWLLGVARNHCRNRSRRERRAVALTDAIREARPRPVPSEADGLHGPDLDTDLAPLLAALAELSTDDQELLTLSIWRELGPSEIAVVLGVRVGAVRGRLLRARRRLEHGYRSRLGPASGEERDA